MAQQDANAAAAAPKSHKKRWLLLVAAALVVGAAGGGAGWYFYAKPGAGAAATQVKETAPPVFVTLETFTVNLQPDAGDQFLQVDLALQVRDQGEADRVREQMPSVRNQLLLLMSSKQPSELLSTAGKETLRKEIIAQLGRSFGSPDEDPAVLDVFFTSFVIQ